MPIARPQQASTAAPPANTPADSPTPPRRPSNLNPTPDSTPPQTTNKSPQQQPTPQDPNPLPTPKNNGDGVAAAQTHADADVATCQDLQSQASLCCNNPTSCAGSLNKSAKASYASLMSQSANGPAPGQSISDYCSQMKTASQNNGIATNGFASICAGNQNSCKSTCTQMANKYQTLLDNCKDCDEASIYLTTIDALNSAVSDCGNLQAKVNSLGTAGISSGSTTAYASMCQQDSSDGSGGGGSGGGSSGLGAASIPPGLAAAIAASNAANSASAAAQAAAAQQPVAPQSGKAGFGTNAATPASTAAINVPSLSDALAGTVKSNEFYKGQSLSGAAGANPTVPNNTGGGIPGTTNPMSTAAEATAKRSAMVSGISTDILQGTMSGGYSRAPGDSSIDSPNKSRARGPASSGSDPGYFGLDLRKYLPGATQDPNRKLGGNTTGRGEINGQGEDLFLHISNKMDEMCKLGELYQCKE